MLGKLAINECTSSVLICHYVICYLQKFRDQFNTSCLKLMGFFLESKIKNLIYDGVSAFGDIFEKTAGFDLYRQAC